MKKTMQDSKRWELWERLAPVVLEREEGFGNITVGGATDQQGKDNLLDFIASEISKAREEGTFTKEELEGIGELLGFMESDYPSSYWKPVYDKIKLKLTTK